MYILFVKIVHQPAIILMKILWKCDVLLWAKEQLQEFLWVLNPCSLFKGCYVCVCHVKLNSFKIISANGYVVL